MTDKFFAVFFLLFAAVAVVYGAPKLRVTAGIPPIAWIGAAVGGDAAQVSSVLPEGRSPHDYTPGPRDIRNAALSKIFLSSGMSFEKSVCKPLSSRVKVVDVGIGTRRVAFAVDSGHGDHKAHDNKSHDHDGHDCDHHADGLDPHIWMSVDNLMIIAETVRREFSAADPAHAAEYRANCDRLKQELTALKKDITSRLAPYRGREFYVYHPAFGYFADMTGLRQRAVELSGREASGARIAEIIRNARKSGVRVIFVQPQFNPASARAIARQIDGQVVELDPLGSDVPGNLRKMTGALTEAFVAADK